MAKKRIMTIDDLYSFCLNNNFVKFSSNDLGEEIVVDFPATFEKQEKETNRDTEGMTPFVSKAFHDHINLNKSEIQEESFIQNVPSSHLRPILANIITDENGIKDFGSHDFEIVEDENGNEKYIYDEQPVGVIDGTKTTIEYDEEAKVNRAILHGYLYDGYCQDTIDILNRRGETSCSVELSIRAMSFDTVNKVLSLDDFFVSGLTLLGAKVNPGMKGSNLKIEDFASSNTPSCYSQNDDIVKLLHELSDKIDNLSGYTKDFEEGGKTQMFDELLVKYGKTVDDIDFDYAEMSDEELEAKFAEMFEVAETPETEEVETLSEETEIEVETEVEDFTKSFSISHEDIRSALYGLLSSFEVADNEWYYIEQVYDDYFVYSSWNGDKTFGQKYTKDDTNVSLVDERYELFKELLTASEKAELENMRANYAKFEEVSDKLAKYEAEPDKMNILNSADYAQIAEVEDFKALVTDHFDLTVSEVQSKCDEILLAYAKSGSLNFSNEEKQSIGMKKLPVETKASKKGRYGNMFNK